jgi:hypothetical protein
MSYEISTRRPGHGMGSILSTKNGEGGEVPLLKSVQVKAAKKQPGE